MPESSLQRFHQASHPQDSDWDTLVTAPGFNSHEILRQKQPSSTSLVGWGLQLLGWRQYLYVCACSVSESCLALDPMDYSPPGSSVHGILQARILEWVVISLSKRSFGPRERTHVSLVSPSLADGFFTTWEALYTKRILEFPVFLSYWTVGLCKTWC